MIRRLLWCIRKLRHYPPPFYVEIAALDARQMEALEVVALGMNEQLTLGKTTLILVSQRRQDIG